MGIESLITARLMALCSARDRTVELIACLTVVLQNLFTHYAVASPSTILW